MEKKSKREQLLSLLGEMPERHRVEAYTLKIEERESYLVETLILSIHGVEEVPAYFVKPKDTVKKGLLSCFSILMVGIMWMGKKSY